jgi:hypothetical protein
LRDHRRKSDIEANEGVYRADGREERGEGSKRKGKLFGALIWGWTQPISMNLGIDASGFSARLAVGNHRPA